jgi:transcriptional regulator with XRE-family HTH domain
LPLTCPNGEKRSRLLRESSGTIDAMSQSDAPPTPVGQQLAARRDELDLTQDALARRIGITAATVSNAERGRTEINRGKRSKWEQALRLKPGTIGRAYRTGTPLERLDDDPSFADLSDPYERAIWEMDISEDDRRVVIELLRRDREEGGRHSA